MEACVVLVCVCIKVAGGGTVEACVVLVCVCIKVAGGGTVEACVMLVCLCVCVYKGGSWKYGGGMCRAGHWTQHGRQVDLDASSRLHYHSRTAGKCYSLPSGKYYRVVQKYHCYRVFLDSLGNQQLNQRTRKRL